LLPFSSSSPSPLLSPSTMQAIRSLMRVQRVAVAATAATRTGTNNNSNSRKKGRRSGADKRATFRRRGSRAASWQRRRCTTPHRVLLLCVCLAVLPIRSFTMSHMRWASTPYEHARRAPQTTQSAQAALPAAQSLRRIEQILAASPASFAHRDCACAGCCCCVALLVCLC
jgi:hypothetical protein